MKSIKEIYPQLIPSVDSIYPEQAERNAKKLQKSLTAQEKRPVTRAEARKRLAQAYGMDWHQLLRRAERNREAYEQELLTDVSDYGRLAPQEQQRGRRSCGFVLAGPVRVAWDPVYFSVDEEVRQEAVEMVKDFGLRLIVIADALENGKTLPEDDAQILRFIQEREGDQDAASLYEFGENFTEHCEWYVDQFIAFWNSARANEDADDLWESDGTKEVYVERDPRGDTPDDWWLVYHLGYAHEALSRMGIYWS